MRKSLYILLLLSSTRWLSILITTLNVVLVSSEPHPHFGVVKPFKSGDPGVKLDRSALTVLKSGKPYKTQIQDGSAGRGLVVQDVQAPVDVVWGRILDFNRYSKMVPKTVESAIYKTENLRGGKKRIFVRMKVGFPVLKLQFFINHLYDPSQNSLTWTLDYASKSDLDDSAGYWYVIPHPDNNKWTRVYYSVEVSMFAWVPQFVVDFMSKQALTDATAWVRKFSELEEAKRSGQQRPNPPSNAVNGMVDGQVVCPPKRTRRFWPLPRRGAQTSPDAACSATTSTGLQAKDGAGATIGVRPISLTRYSLVVMVLSLVLYNIHLYFSQ